MQPRPLVASPRAAAPRLAVLAAFALSGAAALSYEVVWTRALSVVLGSTTHALSSMLATFMLGLAIGGVLGGRVVRLGRDPLLWFGLCELGIGALGISALLVMRSLPAAYLALYRALHLNAPAFYVVQLALCSAVMLGPTVLMGMTFPLVARALAPVAGDVGPAVGDAYGANTLGAVLGSLATGFALVPLLGLRGATVVAAAANAVVGLTFVARSWGARRAAPLLLVLAALAAAGARGPVTWSLVNFYSAHRLGEELDFDTLDRGEHEQLVRLFDESTADGRVVALRDSDGNLILQVDGKVEGTGTTDRPNTLLLAYLPVAAHAGARDMLVVGLGAGVTLEAARGAVPRVELVEINRGVLEAVRRHGPPGVLDGVAVHRDDARNFLLRSERRWDVISSEPSYPTGFAVANLFTRDYFELAASRLAEGGIYCQWLPYYMLTNDDVTMMVKTFGSVFPETTLWKVAGSMDLLLLGSDRPFARAPDAVVARVRELNGGVPLAFTLSRGPGQVAEIARREDVPVNTDDHPVLEFRVARNFIAGQLKE